MKIWEILKEENVGKTYKCNNENYEIYESFGGLALRKESTICDQLDFDIYNFMTLNFEFIQQPVTFEEVLNSDKKCRVEDEKLNKVIEKINALSNSSANEFLIRFKKGEYLNFNNLLELFVWIFSNSKIKQIIKEAKWYLEP